MKGFQKRHELAQSAAELAIFGGILIFVIGSIARLGLSNTTGMNSQLKALRLALSESYKTAEGFYAPGTEDYFAARNEGAVLLLEDRLTVDAGKKLRTRDRIPFMALGNGSFSKNMFFTPDVVDAPTQVPIYDIIVNGQRFPFTTAGVKEVPITASVFTAVPNMPASEDWCVTVDCANRFDLDRDGTPDVPAADWASFAWQWMEVTELDPEKADTTSVDVDGDLKEEVIIDLRPVDIAGVVTPVVTVMDYQDGDLDFTAGDSDPDVPRMLDKEGYMKSVTENPTSLRVQQGNGGGPLQYVKSTLWQQHTDLIQRVFFLANDTERFCQADGTPAPDVAGLPNPVQHCSPSAACPDCFAPGCRAKTCMDKTAKVIFIRSQIRDLRGRRWLTQVTP